MNKTTIGFIGLGLIGGSMAKALRRTHPDFIIRAFDSNRENLTAALRDGILNHAHDSIDASFADCRIIFLCAPVSINIEKLKDLKTIIDKNCILTDVGSVKSSIHGAVITYDLEENFIGGHPMTGSEKTGYPNANGHLFENAYYIITPTEKSNPVQVDFLINLLKETGTLPLVLDYHEHDFITAAISHLPHIIAYTLVNLVRGSDNEEGLMQMLAAGGFKDITRIASSSPVMWQQICIENNTYIQKALETYMTGLTKVNRAIANHNTDFLTQYFNQAKTYRDNIPLARAKGYIKPLYEIYVDIIDEAGAIATLSTILASNSISIKNIGIVHNREFQEGALRIEFDAAGASGKAARILRKFHYTVHERC